MLFFFFKLKLNNRHLISETLNILFEIIGFLYFKREGRFKLI